MGDDTDPGTTRTPATGLAALAAAHPWPASRPESPTSDWGWGIEGEDLLRRAVPTTATVVVEIGTLLGASARFFATHCPEATIVCVDPWFDVDDPADRPFLAEVPELTEAVVGRPDGIHQVFLASNWDLRDRLIPVRGFSPDALAPIHGHGVEADVVYIDGSHVYEDVIADLTTARALFPDAVLCGDDWNWPGVHHAVGYVATNRGDTIETAGNTWLLHRGGGTGRHPAPSARTVGPVEHSLPRKLIDAGLDRYRNR